MLFESEPYVIKVCQFLGLAPFSRRNSTKWSLNRVYEVITIMFSMVIASCFLLCLIFNGIVIDHSRSSLNVAIAVYAIITICIHAFVILNEHFYKRHYHVQLLNLFTKLETFLKCRHGIELDAKGMRNFLHRVLLFWAMQTFGVLILHFIIMIKTNNHKLIYFISIYVLPFLLSKLSYVYSMFLIKILHKNVDGLIEFTVSLCANGEPIKRNVNVISIVAALNHRRSHRNDVSLCTLDFLRRSYQMLWDASNLLNDIYYWSFPIGFFNEFSVFVFNAFSVTQIVKGGYDGHFLRLLFSVTWAALNIINIYSITSACGNTAQAVISSI